LRDATRGLTVSVVPIFRVAALVTLKNDDFRECKAFEFDVPSVLLEAVSAAARN
jgi:hypothetical protein